MLIVVALFGLIIGSFINAVVWRLHLRVQRQASSAERLDERRKTKDARPLSVWRGRSMCPDCRHQLVWFDLMPVASWIMLSGRCRYCGKPISPQYPFVELITAALFGLSFLALKPPVTMAWILFGFWLYFLTVLIILSIYDLRWYLLPDVVLLPAIVAALLEWAVKLGFFHALIRDFGAALLAALAAAGFFYLLAAVSKGRWMGGGDIKLVFLMGLLLGLAKTGLALVLAFNVAAVVGVGLILAGLKKRQDYIPFGPFLCAAIITTFLFGQRIIEWYLRASHLSV